MNCIYKNKIVGEYKRVDIVVCNCCKQESVLSSEVMFHNEDWIGSFNNYGIWICPFCKEEDASPNFNIGKQFLCPDCNENNIQVSEPHSIEYRNGDKIVAFVSDEITCMYCDSEFGLAVTVENIEELEDPACWKYILYKREKNNAETW